MSAYVHDNKWFHSRDILMGHYMHKVEVEVTCMKHKVVHALKSGHTVPELLKFLDCNSVITEATKY